MKFLLIIILYLFSCKPYSSPYLELALKDWEGKEHKLSEFKGKLVVLDFWATWCEPCKKSAPLLDSLREMTDPNKTIFLGINTDSDKTIEEIKSASLEFGMKYPSLLDPELRLVDTLGVKGQPGVFLLDRDGRVLHSQYGVVFSDINKLLQKIRNEEN